MFPQALILIDLAVVIGFFSVVSLFEGRDTAGAA